MTELKTQKNDTGVEELLHSIEGEQKIIRKLIQESVKMRDNT